MPRCPIVCSGGRVTAPNTELMALEMAISTALVVGCSSWYVHGLHGGYGRPQDLFLTGQVSSLVVCSALWSSHRGPPLIPSPVACSSKEEWKIHHELMRLQRQPRKGVPKGVAQRFADPCKEGGQRLLRISGLNGKPLKPTTSKGGVWSLFLASWQQLDDCVGHAEPLLAMLPWEVCLQFHPREPTHCWFPPLTPANQGSYPLHRPQGNVGRRPRASILPNRSLNFVS